MARITLRQLLDHAAEHGYGVPAFNINNMEQGLAIMEAADAVKAPVIIQASRGARSYANDIMLAKLIDALAIAMGTSHGAYKFTRKPDGDILAMGVIEEIHRRLPNTHLVMHGSSTVPQDLQDIINEFGGQMPQTFGVPVEEIQRGIKHGVRKINIDTDCRMAMSGQVRRVLMQNPAEFDPRKYLKPAMEAMTKICRQRFEEFGAVGHAERIKVLPLSVMAKRYAAGELSPKFGLSKQAAE